MIITRRPIYRAVRWVSDGGLSPTDLGATLRMVAASGTDRPGYHDRPLARMKFLAYGGDFEDRPCDWGAHCDGIYSPTARPSPQPWRSNGLLPVTLTPSIDPDLIDAVVLPAPPLTCVCVPGSR